MCTGGINVSQFKLSTHQMMQVGELYQKSIKQWADLANDVGSEVVARKLTEASEQISTVGSCLQAAMDELDQLSSEGESVTITPL